MITESYRDTLIEHRKTNPEWGGSAVRNAGDHIVRWLNKRKDITSVLDFGCGIGTLGKYVQGERGIDGDIEWHEYDPSIPGKDTLPDRMFDAIVTTDVMEHIEPESLDGTLDWLCEHAAHWQFHHIDCNLNAKHLPDGRSVHLIVKPMTWWESTIVLPGWKLVYRSSIQQLKRSRMRGSGTIIVGRV